MLHATNCSTTNCLQGVAYGAGYLTGCQVTLSSSNTANSTAFTDANGTFNFPVDATSLINATVTIPMGNSTATNVVVANGTIYNCTDSATNLAPRFSVTARVPTNGSAVMAVNAITTATALAISEVGRLPAIVQTILGASGTVTPDSVFNLLSLQTSGLPGLAAVPYINTLTNLSDPTLAKYYSLNAQIFNTLTLSAQRVAAVANGTVSGTLSDIDAALQELTAVLIPSLTATIGTGSSTANLSLTDAQTIANTLSSAVQGVSSTSSSSTSQVVSEAATGLLNTVSSLTGILGRRLLVDSAVESGAARKLLQSNSTADPVSTAVGTVVATINRDLQDLVPTNGSINGTQLQQDAAGLLSVAQAAVFEAVPAISKGIQSVTDFTAMYTGVNLTRQANAALAILAREAPGLNVTV